MTVNPRTMQQEECEPVRGGVLSISVWCVRPATALVVLILTSVLVTACTSAPGESTQTSGSGPEVEAPRTGRELFASNCAACHGAAGEGHPDWRIKNADGTLPPPPLNGDGHTWHHADGLLYRIVSQGGKSLEVPGDTSFKSAMPAFGDQLSHAEIIEVLAYVKSLWGDKANLGLSIRETQAQISERDPFPSRKGKQ